MLEENLKKPKSYIYSTGEMDAERLQLLNEVYNPNSKLALKKADITTKKCIVELGCGQGNILSWIAAEKSPDCVLVGIDSSSNQLALANKKTQNYKNILLIEKNVTELDSDFFSALKLQPDLIYCRWLFMHINNNQINDICRKIFNLLAPNGIAVFEDVAINPELHSDDNMRTYCNLFTDLAKKIQVDYNIGSKLKYLMQQQGFTNISENYSAPKFTQKQKKFFRLDLLTAVKYFEKYQLCEYHQLKKLADDIMHSQSQNITMNNHICIGYKI